MILALVACTAARDPSPPALRELLAATDLDPDPAVLEVDLLAHADGARWTWVDPWGGGSFLDLGGAERLVVHLTNALPVSTTLHIHGLRLLASQDGTVHSQHLVFPGESHDYFVDVVDEGLAWYHPHFDSAEQVERGLYAPIRAQGGDPLPVSADRVIVLDDTRLLPDGSPDLAETPEDRYAGRVGDVLLVNGDPAGIGTVVAGRRERWRFLNAANARVFRLDLHATEIAHEGGTLAVPRAVEEVVLSPGDRVEVVVDVLGGERFDVSALPYDRGYGAEPAEPEVLFSVLGIGGPPPGPLPIRAARPSLSAPDAALRELVFSRVSPDRYAVDGESWPFNTPLTAEAGAVERWALRNDTEAELPFHLHGTFMQAETGWEDVVTVPPHDHREVLVPLDAPGAWMFHSHVLEHAELGMMGVIDVRAGTPE